MYIFFSRKTLSFVLIVISAIFLFYHAFFKNKGAPQHNAVAVNAHPVIQKDVVTTAAAIGNVQPFASVSMKSRVDGQLLSVGFKEGDFVEKDQIVFEIDPEPFKVALAEAKANLARDEAQADNLNHLLARYTELLKKDYVSKQDYDQAVANSKAQMATVAADKAAVENAELQLSYCTIRAPISGRTGSLLSHPGDLIKATDTNPLVIINQISPIYVVFSVPEYQLSVIQDAMRKGPLTVNIALKDTQQTLVAPLHFIDNTVDTTTGMIELKALYSNNQHELWPGQYVNVTLPLATIKQAILVPTRAIQAGPEGSYVFVVTEDSHVKFQPVKVGPAIDNQTIIQKGLSSHMTVVTEGQTQLVDGSTIQVES